jgi:cation diffusion facilitator family transporter
MYNLAMVNEAVNQHYAQIKRILIAILGLNWAVALAKIIYGLYTHCNSMAADGFHSLSDGTSNIIGLIGIHIASKPRDINHPYGHKKYETLFTLVIAGLLLTISMNLISKGISRFFDPVTPKIDIISFLVMLLTLAVNLAVMNYEYNKGKLLQSDILISDSLHTKADIFISLSVIITLIAIKLGYPILDPIVTVVIALFIIFTAFKIIKDSAHVLCDTVVADTQRISDVVLGIKGVRACHKIRTRGRPDDINLDLHVQVSPDMHIDKAHELSYAIEETIKREIPQITDVVVHMEPKEKN